MTDPEPPPRAPRSLTWLATAVVGLSFLVIVWAAVGVARYAFTVVVGEDGGLSTIWTDPERNGHQGALAVLWTLALTAATLVYLWLEWLVLREWITAQRGRIGVGRALTFCLRWLLPSYFFLYVVIESDAAWWSGVGSAPAVRCRGRGQHARLSPPAPGPWP
jgi:hypothetical protein